MSRAEVNHRRGSLVSAYEGETINRLCLTCGALFASQGAHNRMCDDCRSKHRGEGSYVFHTGRSARGWSHVQFGRSKSYA